MTCRLSLAPGVLGRNFPYGRMRLDGHASRNVQAEAAQHARLPSDTVGKPVRRLLSKADSGRRVIGP